MTSRKLDPPREVKAIRAAIKAVMKTVDATDQPVGKAKCGVYAFYDYDGEPIYVGQTYEGINSRVGRHLTGQRSDAVAKHVLDPFEVCDIEVWPLWGLEKQPENKRKAALDMAEFTVFKKLIKKSLFSAILNEGDVKPRKKYNLPVSIRGRIIPEEVYERRIHADLRIARRANTIASLAKVISERDVSLGLRRVLLTQAKRLEHLAQERLGEVK